MGFGGGLLLLFFIGFVVLGPEQMHKLLGQVVRAKAQLDKATHNLKANLAEQLEARAPKNE